MRQRYLKRDFNSFKKKKKLIIFLACTYSESQHGRDTEVRERSLTSGSNHSDPTNKTGPVKDSCCCLRLVQFNNMSSKGQNLNGRLLKGEKCVRDRSVGVRVPSSFRYCQLVWFAVSRNRSRHQDFKFYLSLDSHLITPSVDY